VERVEYQEPHPNWTEVVILWKDVLNGPKYPIRDILNWVEFAPGNRYHLHGHQSVKGFAFRFEDPTDATYFQLRWM
jgi:hypothetical protein